MGAVWPRANAPTGATSSPVRKLTVWMSFIVVLAMLRSTFLAANLGTIVTFSLLAPLAYHERGALVKQSRLRLLADVSIKAHISFFSAVCKIAGVDKKNMSVMMCGVSIALTIHQIPPGAVASEPPSAATHRHPRPGSCWTRSAARASR